MENLKRDQVALFRYQVIAPLLGIDPGDGRLRDTIQVLSERPWEIPFSHKTSISEKTIEEWFYKYKRCGFDALKPSMRDDSGQSRKISGEIAVAIEEMLRAQPKLTAPLVLKELIARGLMAPKQFSSNTLYRFREAQGLDKVQLQGHQDRRAFTFEYPNDCWQSDMLFGPSIAKTDGSRANTFLYAIMDDSTRLICHAQFYLQQDFSVFQDCLKQALMKRGCPKKLYVDNAKVFSSRAILAACATLGIHLIHSQPYRPQGRGKIERWFSTLRSDFVARLDSKALTDIDQINHLLWAWIEGEYHQRIHRGIDESPIDKWIRLSNAVRPIPDSVDLDRVFFSRVTRKVKQDGTFTIKRKLFEAGVLFIGETLDVLFDPFDLRSVWISSKRHPVPTQAFPVDLIANRVVTRLPDPPKPTPQPIQFHSLENLKRHMDLLNKPSVDDDDQEGDPNAPVPCPS